MSLHPSLFHMKIVSESRTFPAELSAEIRPLPPDPNKLWYDYINGELTEITDEIFSDDITTIRSYMFEDQRMLSSISLNNVQYIDPYVFSNCGTSLGTNKFLNVNLPNVRQIMDMAFGNAKIKNVIFPELSFVGSYCFRNCNYLETADFSNLTMIGSSAFRDCSSLTTVILRYPYEVITLTGSYAYVFTGTPIMSGAGHIYVPQALYTNYINDYRWSTYADAIRTIEDSNL